MGLALSVLGIDFENYFQLRWSHCICSYSDKLRSYVVSQTYHLRKKKLLTILSAARGGWGATPWRRWQRWRRKRWSRHRQHRKNKKNAAKTMQNDSKTIQNNSKNYPQTFRKRSEHVVKLVRKWFKSLSRTSFIFSAGGSKNFQNGVLQIEKHILRQVLAVLKQEVSGRV